MVQSKKEGKSLQIDNKLIISTKVEGSKFVITRKTHLEERKLIYNSELCVGCGMCAEVCLSGCIKLNHPLYDRFRIVINAENCYLCGVCSEVCIFNAIDVISNGKSIKDMPCSPRYSVVYSIDTSKCPEGCNACELACPRNALKCESKDGKTIVLRNETLCVYCTSCKLACPEGAILVEKPISGEIKIDTEKCQLCGFCAEICPTKAIKIDDGIKVKEDICIYCKTCEKVCAVNAITVKRKSINVISHAKGPWTKVHEEAFKKLVR